MKNHSIERKRLRLSGYDYSSDGLYFVTICTQDCRCFFGDIGNGAMELNDIGCIIAECLQGISGHFDGAELDEWAIMPNHVHAVVVIERGFNHDTFLRNIRDAVGDGYAGDGCDGIKTHLPIVGDRHACPLPTMPIKPQCQLLPVIIGSFKSAVTKYINKSGINTDFRWQRSYYDHIIRNDKSLNRICDYIKNNPSKWESDAENRMNRFSKSQIKKHYDDLFK